MKCFQNVHQHNSSLDIFGHSVWIILQSFVQASLFQIISPTVPSSDSYKYYSQNQNMSEPPFILGGLLMLIWRVRGQVMLNSLGAAVVYWYSNIKVGYTISRQQLYNISAPVSAFTFSYATRGLAELMQNEDS